MNEPTLFDREDRLFELANRACGCGGLTPTEEVELSGILSDSAEARELWAAFWQMEAALEQSDGIHAILGDRPENVLSMPGMKNGGAGTVDGESAEGEKSAMGNWWKYAAAAVVAFALGVLGMGLLGPNSYDSNVISSAKESVNAGKAGELDSGVDSEKVSVSEDGVKEGSDPESQYQKLLASADGLGTGSLVRPNVNIQLVSAAGSAILAPGEKLSFNKHVRPILSDNCFACHGPDEHGRKAKLRLDTEEGAKESVIVVGDLEASELVARIISDDPDEVMPTPESHKKLSADQIALLKRWVMEGAVYEGHWAFAPPVRTLNTKLLPVNVKRGENEVDLFVGQVLEKEGVGFSKEARKETLIRRATLDVTGLPPTLADLQTTIADESEIWFESMVDRLLASSAYGEHRARYWLDAARYGDTHGLHLDNYREIWPYRDWVISAFNSNMPYDQFTIEQLAGDLLPEATQAQRVATGFNRCNVTTSEGGAIEEEFLMRYAVDRVSTTSTVWLGLTTGCAQCHDHKFDPITQKEFYELYAYFNNTTQPGMDGNAKDSAPVIRVYRNDADDKQAAELRTKIGAAKAALKKLEAIEQAGFNKWNVEQRKVKFEHQTSKLAGEVVTSLDKVAGDESLNLGTVGRFEKSKPFSVSFRYALPEMDNDGRVTLLSKVDDTQKGRGWRVFVDQQSMNVEMIEEAPNKVLKTGATRSYKSKAAGLFTITYDGSGSGQGFALYKNDRLQTSRFTNEWADTLVGDFASDAPLVIGGKDEESGHVPAVSEVRIFDRQLTADEVKALNGRGRLAGLLKKEKQEEKDLVVLRAFYMQTNSEKYQAQLIALSGLETELSRIESRTPFTLVMQEKAEAAKAHVLDRGEYDQKTEEVTPGLPAFLPKLAGEFEPNRLGLAKWLVHPEHPLTARVTVNRMWQELFGTGLVKSSEDFGVQGESPSHPELLDWLAITFIESGWDVKAIYKTMLMSRTYRQDSASTPEMLAMDSENRLMARGPRFRLDAEVIRDQALAVSGLMDQSVGGPSVKPYQPSGIWQTVGYTNSNTQTFFQDFGKSAEHRRTLYSFWKRTAPPPNMAIFDAPNREDCIVRRERTNTPLQALVLMNDPQFVRASRYLALRALNEQDNVEGRLDFLSKVLRGREMDADEKTIVMNSLDQFKNAYSSDEAAAERLLVDEVNPTFSLGNTNAVELASWTMVASQLMNLDEVVNKN